MFPATKEKKKKKKSQSDTDPREKVKEHIRIAVGERFRQVPPPLHWVVFLEHTTHRAASQVFADCGEDVKKIISQTASLMGDLDTVVKEVVPCFPEQCFPFFPSLRASVGLLLIRIVVVVEASI